MSLPYDELKDKVLSRYGELDSIPENVYLAMRQYKELGVDALDDDNVYNTLIAERDYVSPTEMRARAKAEFASDWLAQKKAEAESIRETPMGKVASALFPKSVENEIQRRSYGNSPPEIPVSTQFDALKDMTSMPGRVLSQLVAGDRENLQAFSEEYPILTKTAGVVRGIVEDPLLPLFMGIGSAPIPIGAKMAAGSVLPFTDITLEKGKVGETPTLTDAGISLLQGVLPEAIGLGVAKYGARALRAAENIEPLKKITAYKDFLNNEFGSIAKKESPSIGEVQEILRKGLAEGKLQASMRKKAEEILRMKNSGEYGGDIVAEFSSLARDKLANATVGRTTKELGSELMDKLKGVLPGAAFVMALEAALGRVPLAGAAYGATKTAIKMEPSLAPRIGKLIQGVGENVNLPKFAAPAAKQLAGRVPQSAIAQVLRTSERMDTQTFSDNDARLYNRQMEILRFDPNDASAKRIAQEIASKYRK